MLVPEIAVKGSDAVAPDNSQMEDRDTGSAGAPAPASEPAELSVSLSGLVKQSGV